MRIQGAVTNTWRAVRHAHTVQGLHMGVINLF